MLIETYINSSTGPRKVFLMLSQIEAVREAGPSSQYHGIKSFICMKDGKEFEGAETVYEISAKIQAALKPHTVQCLLADKAKLRAALIAVMARFDPMGSPGLDLNEAAYKLATTALEETK